MKFAMEVHLVRHCNVLKSYFSFLKVLKELCNWILNAMVFKVWSKLFFHVK